jgi:hypothetical protein
MNSYRLYQDTMTDAMRHDLALHCYQQGFLDEHVIGHSPPNLFYTSSSQAADADQQARPDDFYFQAQGQEPPPPVEVEAGQHWYNCLELKILLTAIAVMLVILVFWPVGGW